MIAHILHTERRRFIKIHFETVLKLQVDWCDTIHLEICFNIIFVQQANIRTIINLYFQNIKNNNSSNQEKLHHT